MTQLEIALQAENKKLADKLQLMQTIATRDKFYTHFFKISLNYKTRKEAFDYLNTLYAELFGDVLFSSYESFKMYYSRKLK